MESKRERRKANEFFVSELIEDAIVSDVALEITATEC
jgi:hypothetical protein